MLILLVAGTVTAALSTVVVPDDLNDAVGFVFVDTGSGRRVPIGTAFFVSVPVEGKEGRVFVYLVTAKHVLEPAGKKLPQVFLRLNKKGDSGVEYLPLNLKRSAESGAVLYHPDDETVDLAAVLLNGSMMRDVANFKYIPSSMLIDRGGDEGLHIRAGTDVFFSGLFVNHMGTERNFPITRFGRVAMITDEKVVWKERGRAPQALDLYLIETMTFGGNSGAPVFFYFGADREPGKLNLGPPVLKLGGVIKGHFNDGQEIVSVENDDTKQYSIQNVGIAAVVPGYLVKELLFSEAAESYRKARLH